MAKRRSTHRLVSICLCILLVSVAFLSMHLAASHVFHDCVGDLCTQCAIVHSAQHLLRQLLLAVLSVFLVTAASIAGFHMASRASRRRKASTLITCKTRMNP